MRKYMFAAIAITALSVPAFAAAQFYVAQDAMTKKCSVVEKKPDGKALMMIGKASYDSNAKAEIALKADKTCK